MGEPTRPDGSTARKSIWQRKLDLLYLIFFVIHIPIMLSMDLSGYCPSSLRPAYTIKLHEFYISSYRDRFFIDPPAWFHTFMFLEATYHIPLSIWAIGALLRDDVMVPVQLLAFGMEVGVTTMVCVAEMLSWEGYTREELGRLCGLYVPYLVFAAIMILDNFFRLKRVVIAHASNLSIKKVV